MTTSSLRLIWQCVHCGGLSLDLYGKAKLSKHWDETCVRNAFPVEDSQDDRPMRYAPNVLVDELGWLHPTTAVGSGQPYVAPPTYEEQIARLALEPGKLKTLNSLPSEGGNPP